MIPTNNTIKEQLEAYEADKAAAYTNMKAAEKAIQAMYSALIKPGYDYRRFLWEKYRKTAWILANMADAGPKGDDGEFVETWNYTVTPDGIELAWEDNLDGPTLYFTASWDALEKAYLP